jgi:hypothetical protein
MLGHEQIVPAWMLVPATGAVLRPEAGMIRRCRGSQGRSEGARRRASQRTNVKVHVLAARIVEQVASGSKASNVTPISLGTTRYLRSRTADTATHRPD